MHVGDLHGPPPLRLRHAGCHRRGNVVCGRDAGLHVARLHLRRSGIELQALQRIVAHGLQQVLPRHARRRRVGDDQRQRMHA
jgi:hypothetical protein